MQWHEFIFSKEGKYKITRHFVFWVAWWFYFLLCYFVMQQPIPLSTMQPGHVMVGHNLPLKTFLILLLYAVACYPLMYYQLPLLLKRQWVKAMGSFILLFSFLLVASHLLYWDQFPIIDSASGHANPTRKAAWFWPAVNLGIMNFIKIAATAAIIKYLKHWWLKQKESQRLEKEKINAELQLLKAQVHPDFLFKTLNNIYTHALSSSPRTPGMLLKLSDLLSYMLYECDQPTVPLKKEIEMMKEYMQLEKVRYNDEPELQVSIKGALEGKRIAPFLLLPLIENSFRHCGQMTEQFWINMDIDVDENNFLMKLTNGVSENSIDPVLMDANGLFNVQKRLALLYPGNHELKTTTEQEMSIVLLTIRLENTATILPDQVGSVVTANDRPLTTVLKYVPE